MSKLSERLVPNPAIGKGSYSRVHKTTVDNKKAAIKIPNGNLITFESLREIYALTNLHHKNIVKMLKTQYENHKLSIILEFCPLDLSKYIHDSSVKYKDGDVYICRNILHGIHYIHTRGFIHGDIKPSNILLRENGDPVICDFGLTSVRDPRIQPKSRFVGTPSYRAPEIYLNESYDEAIDMWSYGCLLYEVFHKEILIDETSIIGALKKILEIFNVPDLKTDPKLQDIVDQIQVTSSDIVIDIPNAPEDLRKILKMSLVFKSEDRISSSDAMAELLITNKSDDIQETCKSKIQWKKPTNSSKYPTTDNKLIEIADILLETYSPGTSNQITKMAAFVLASSLFNTEMSFYQTILKDTDINKKELCSEVYKMFSALNYQLPVDIVYSQE